MWKNAEQKNEWIRIFLRHNFCSSYSICHFMCHILTSPLVLFQNEKYAFWWYRHTHTQSERSGNNIPVERWKVKLSSTQKSNETLDHGESLFSLVSLVKLCTNKKNPRWRDVHKRNGTINLFFLNVYSCRIPVVFTLLSVSHLKLFVHTGAHTHSLNDTYRVISSGFHLSPSIIST